MSAGRVTPPRLALFLAVALLAAAPPSAFAQLRSRHRLSVAMAGPAGVTANWVSNGVKIDWQAVPEAVQYNVLRGPDGTTVGTQIGAVRGDVFTFTDVGFAGTAGYQVIAVAADGRQGASAIVLYTPPATLSTTKLTTTTLSTTLSTTMLRTATSFSDPAAPPVIAAFGGTGAPDLFAKVGETVTIAGTGLDGLTSVKLVDAYKPLTTWVVNTAGGSYPVSPANVTPTSFSFVVGQLTTSMSQYRPFLLIVTKATGTDTSNGAIQVVYPQPTRSRGSRARTSVAAHA
jgi:hypothetical protein